jgi:hypothetical protein
MVSGPTRPNREVYLQALAATPLVEIVLGNFKKKSVRCKLSACTYAGLKLFETYEEKRTDLNIADSRPSKLLFTFQPNIPPVAVLLN